MYGEQEAIERKISAMSGSALRRTPVETVTAQIAELQERLSDLQELKGILESEPKMSRALEIMSRRGGF